MLNIIPHEPRLLQYCRKSEINSQHALIKCFPNTFNSNLRKLGHDIIDYNHSLFLSIKCRWQTDELLESYLIFPRRETIFYCSSRGAKISVTKRNSRTLSSAGAKYSEALNTQSIQTNISHHIPPQNS